MQTLNEILGRKEERQNLRSLGLCVLVTLSLVVASFGAAHLRSLFQGAPHQADVAVEAAADRY